MTDNTHSGHASSAGGTGSSHSSTVLNNANLAAVLQPFQGADRVFFADLNELNNSEAEGGALLLLKSNKLTVITAARGVEPSQNHVQHIHGFEDGREATVPTLAQDDDKDGFIELAEGLDTYGPILLNLTATPGGDLSGFPTPMGDSFLFSKTYDLDGPKSGDLAKLLDDVSLSRREIVLHGDSTLAGHGQGTTGEVDGSAGYKLVLPIASGEIRELSYDDALFSFQTAVSLRLGKSITGGSGHDNLSGGRGSESLLGRAGNDRLSGGRGDDYLDGDSGRDWLSGDSGNDYLDGGSNHDRLFGNSGNDQLYGGSGNDELAGGAGHDHLYGGSGNDRAFFNVSKDDSDSVDLGSGSDLVNVSAASRGQVRLTFTSAEVGNGAATDSNAMANQDGGLAIRLQAENNSGDLVGEVSRYDDEGMSFIASSRGLTFDVRDLVSGVARGDQFGVVTLGTTEGDNLRAVLSDRAYYFNAGMGNDRVVGGNKSDFLVGGAGNDALSGQAGSDKFIAGAGNDVLRGGVGDDVFIFAAPLNASTNVDRIGDFRSSDDTLQLDDAAFIGLATGTLSGSAFALFSASAEADDRVIYDQGTGGLFFDANGGTRDDAVLFARLENKATVNAADFFVI